MPDLHSGPRCSGTRMLRWAAVVVPAAVVLSGSFGTAGAYAAPGGNAAAQAATSSANANHGVGKMAGNGNDKHVDVASTDTSTTSAAATPTVDSTATSHVTDGTAATVGDPGQPQPLSTADKNAGGANGQCSDTTNMGPYCSTRGNGTGSPQPSGNGNGNGKAVGKPCAGCVGKADNKNPKGQFPNGSDHNAGYECDRNHGIGRTNPAHTGCKSTPPPPPVCNAPNTLVNGVCTPPTTECSAPNTLVNGVCTPPTSDCTTNPTAAGCTPGGGGDCTTNPTAAGCQSENGGGDCTTNPTAAACGNGDGNGDGGSACVPAVANHFCSDVLGEKQTRKPSVQGEKVVNTPGSLPMTGADIGLLLVAAAAGLSTGVGLLVVGARRRHSPA